MYAVGDFNDRATTSAHSVLHGDLLLESRGRTGNPGIAAAKVFGGMIKRGLSFDLIASRAEHRSLERRWGRPGAHAPAANVVLMLGNNPLGIGNWYCLSKLRWLYGFFGGERNLCGAT